ncbi:MAG: HdeD family acid-resistance protein [Terracidiphilus sp.]
MLADCEKSIWNSKKGENSMLDSLTVVQATQEMIHNWGWLLAFGIVLAVLGIVAVARSFAATITSMMFFGWMLVFAGAVEFVNAFMVGHWAGFFLHLLASILFFVIGCLLVIRPLISAEVATLVMSMFFLIGGLYQFIASIFTHLPGWGWQAFSGVISSLMGILLLAQWPLSGLWAIGLFIGIDLIFAGWAWVALALNLRKL